MSHRPCPICNSSACKVFLELDLGALDHEVLSAQHQFLECSQCGMVFNEVQGGETQITQHYLTQANYATHQGAGSGGITSFDLQRYQNAFELIKVHLSVDDKFLDVGCGQGGFLNFLNKQIPIHCCGLDATPGCQELLEQKNILAYTGFSHSIPAPDYHFDFVSMHHILEHDYNPLRSLLEVNRVLKAQGYLYIEIPDAEFYVHDLDSEIFWLGLKEHINHFSKHHILASLEQAGFDVISFTRSHVTIPAMGIVARKTNHVLPQPIKFNSIKDSILHYAQTKLNYYQSIQLKVLELANNYERIVLWGLGFNIVSLIKYLGLNQLDPIYFMDRDLGKSSEISPVLLLGQAIHSTELITQLSERDLILGTSSFQFQSMSNYLQSIQKNTQFKLIWN